MTERESYIAGLHELARLLTEHPEVPLPSWSLAIFAESMEAFDAVSGRLTDTRLLADGPEGRHVDVDAAGFWPLALYGRMQGLAVAVYGALTVAGVTS